MLYNDYKSLSRVQLLFKTHMRTGDISVRTPAYKNAMQA